jgi:uncharacterized protein (TIGR03066 family)
MKLGLPALSGLLILGVATFAVAGSDKAMKLIGIWEVTRSKNAPEGATVEFTKGGKMTTKFKVGDEDIIHETPYVLKDARITTKVGARKEPCTATIKKLTDTILIVEDEDGNTDEFKRVK